MTKSFKEVCIERAEVLQKLEKYIKDPKIKNNIQRQIVLLENVYLEDLKPFFLNEDSKRGISGLKDFIDKKIEKDEVEFVVLHEKKANLEICQILKTTIKNKFESTCGHCFDTIAVVEENGKLIYKNCPIAGCNKVLKEKKN